MESYELRSIIDSRRSSPSLTSEPSCEVPPELLWSSSKPPYVATSSQTFKYSWNRSKRPRKTGDALLPYAIAAVIYDTICRMEMITAVINEGIDPSWKRLDFYKPPEQRFTEKGECESEKYNEFNKFKMYSCILLETLKTCLDELVNSGTLDIIGKVQKRFSKQDRDEEILRLEHKVNRKRLEELRKALKNIAHENKGKLNKKADELHKICEAYHEKYAYSLCELNYVNTYEDNRCYLLKFSNDTKVQNLREEINKYEVQKRNENRIHSEIEGYLEGYASYVENETRNWIIKYDVDDERLDQEISETNEQKYKLELQHENMQREYEQRSVEIDNWLARRKQIRVEEEALRLSNRAATIIQAWWRGEMQRRHLGPRWGKRKARRAQKAKGKKSQTKNFKLKK